MVDVVSVAGTLLPPHPCQRAVEAVTEPVQGKKDDDQQKAGRSETRQPVGETGPQHGDQRQEGEMVGVHRGRHPRGKPEEYPLL